MKDFWLKVASGLVTAAIVANCALLWQLSNRIARIESRLGISTQNQYHHENGS
jgi:hypothetical protein